MVDDFSPASEPIQNKIQQPGGMPLSSNSSTMRTAVPASACRFENHRIPATRAGDFQTGMATGKFHGVTQATTPAVV